MQYIRSKVDNTITEYVYLFPSDMNLRIRKIRRYNNKISIAAPGLKIGTNVKINLDCEEDKPDVKSNKEQKQDIKIIRTKPNTDSNKEHKQDVKPNIEFNKESEPDKDRITYEVALVLGITSVFTVWWMFK